MTSHRQPDNLVELLRHAAETRPDQVAFTFLEDGESQAVPMTCAELDRRARAIASVLSQSLEKGSRALLLYTPGLDYVAGLFGCLYAGVVPVPAYPPNPARLERTLPRLRALYQDAQISAALTTSPLLALAEPLFPEAPDFAALRWVATDVTPPGAEDSWTPPEVDPEALAILQYTSGSTGMPKGVMLSHANLFHNMGVITQTLSVRERETAVFWLPPYHDMGLIGGILSPLYCGGHSVLMPPLAFLERPFRWLDAISRYRASFSGGPNFAFDLAVRKIGPEERAQLDLSSWTLAFNGSEPLRPETLRRFSEAFGPSGFRRSAFFLCYGLAEATLLVSGGKLADATGALVDPEPLSRGKVVEARPDTPGARALLGSGRAVGGQKVVVVNPETCVLAKPGEVGEIWVSGPSVAKGYWNHPEDTERVFQARLARGDGPFLRTGDLGFLRGDELFVAARLKDLIIIRGRNHYPQDIERTVERCHELIRLGCCAAVPIEADGEERLAVVAEVAVERGKPPPELAPVIAAIRGSVSDEHQLQVHTILLLKPSSIPKTSSGKLQRHACRDGLEKGTLEGLAKSVQGEKEQAAAEIEEGLPPLTRPALLALPKAERRARLGAYLCEQASALMDVPRSRVLPSTSLSSLGLDSLASAELRNRIEADLGVLVPMPSVLLGPPPSALAAEILAKLEATSPRALPAPAPEAPPEAPLSYSQEPVWFFQTFMPDSAYYNIPLTLRFTGRLKVSALESALSELVRRHQALRTSFPAMGDGPVQVVAPYEPLSLPVVDLRALPDSERRAEANRLAAEDAQRPFDIARGPLARVTLLKLGDDEHELLLTLHHLVADGWSLAILFREVSVLYAAALAGNPSPLPELELQYTDYARWQRERLSGPLLAGHLAYWKEKMAGAPPILDLPADRPRPAVPSYRGGHCMVTLPHKLLDGISAIGRRHGATPFMAMLAALKALLFRSSGQRDVVVGTVVANRTTHAVERLVGCFMNFLPLRTALTGDETVAEAIRKVRHTVLEAYEHAECPFGKMIETLRPERTLSQSPLYNVAFLFHSFSWRGAFDGALEVTSSMRDACAEMMDLRLDAHESKAGLVIDCEYSVDLFDLPTVDRLLRQFRAVLESFVASPDGRIAELPLLSESERQTLLVEWNDTWKAYPLDKCLHHWVQEQVARTPDAIAVELDRSHLTYRELNRRANQLARFLQLRGVGPEVRVGVCLERSLDMVVALLGVLKAGGVYLPLEPSYPPERIAAVVDDAAPWITVTQERLLGVLPQAGDKLVLDKAWPEISKQIDEEVRSTVLSDHPAYLIYTPGSTGQPKGVVSTHRGICNRLLWMQDAYTLSKGDRVLHKTPLTFDVSVWELFWPLMAGARLVLARPGGQQDPAYLARLIAEQQITIAHFVPSLLHAFLDVPQARDCRSLRHVVCSGEALPYELKERFFERLSSTALHNLYGPTEASVDVSAWTCRPGGGARKLVPIGRPIANTQLYVLDARLQPQPVGVAGELYLGGIGLARGYFRRPDLTAERFVPSPFSDTPGARLYRTGDLARYLPDGSVEFLGRLDHQVKLRGFRIELGEIEAALAADPRVREAVVLAREDTPGDKRLVAYCVPQGDAALSAEELSTLLKAKLPEFMVPSAFVLLDRMPLSPNGKVDRRALPAPEKGRALSGRLVAPRSATEEVLARMWREVLGVPEVGVEDNFFSLGGHSLLAAQIVSRVHERFQVELPILRLFERPTIAALAEVLSEQGAAPADERPALVPLPRAEKGLEELLAELEGLSDDEAQALLARAGAA